VNIDKQDEVQNRMLRQLINPKNFTKNLTKKNDSSFFLFTFVRIANFDIAAMIKRQIPVRKKFYFF